MIILIGIIIAIICIFCAIKCSKYEEKLMTEEQINEKKREEEEANQRATLRRNSDWLLIPMFVLTPIFLIILFFLMF